MLVPPDRSTVDQLQSRLQKARMPLQAGGCHGTCRRSARGGVVRHAHRSAPARAARVSYCPDRYQREFDEFAEHVATARAAMRAALAASPRVARNQQTDGHHDVHARLRDLELRRRRRRGDLPRQPERRADPVPVVRPVPGLREGRQPRAARCRISHLQPNGSPTSARWNPSVTSASRTCRCGTSTPRCAKRSGRAERVSAA